MGERKRASIPQEMADQLTSVLLFAANTHDVIHWPKLRERLARTPSALSEREHCDLLLAAVNGKRLTGRQWNQLVGATIQRGLDDRAVVMPQSARAGFASNLRVITEGTDAERAELAEDAARIAAGSVLLAPSWSAKEGRKDRVVTTGMCGALAYGLWLLLDPQRPFGRDLCRCRFSACGEFFFKRAAQGGRGAPVRRYCSSEHADAGDAEQAVVRMRRNRQ